MKITITNTQTIVVEDNHNNHNNPNSLLDHIVGIPEEVKEQFRKAAVRNGFRRLIAQMMKNN